MSGETFNLPDDAVKFLRDGRQLEYDASKIEAREVKLKRFEELVLKEVWINTNNEGDPHFMEEGYYSIPAVSLTGECKSYDPEFILLWLPDEKLFGAWDCDHGVLTVFRGVSWPEIEANPAVYLNAQWDAGRNTGEYFLPWPKYPFKAGFPI